MNIRQRGLVVAVLTAANAHAAISVYDSQAAFQAALSTPVTTIDFNGVGSLARLPSPSAFSGVTFSASSLLGGDFTSSVKSNPGYTDGYLISMWGMTITPPAYTTSAGFDLGAYFGNSTTVTATAFTNLGHSLSAINTSATTMIYRGFVTAGGEYITSISITQTSDRNYEAIDDFTFGTAAVPEPASAGVIAAGLALIACYARRFLPKR
ncbi:MAG: hypothetical protein IPL39_05400 [Opitutaceae bacterium]|nr:hypothetical protein [Opitutaceae bacterium]